MIPKLSIVIPMYNEEKIAAQTARTLTDFFDGKFPDGDYEIVFSNDGSRDRCAEAVEELQLPRVRVVGYPDNRGKGSAVREGVLAAVGEAVVYTDCDLAYGCDAVFEIYNELLNTGSDLVIGSRNLSADGYEGYTFLRKLMSKTYIRVISLLAGFSYSDSQCGIKCMKRSAAEKIFRKCTVNGFAFDLEVLILAGKYKMKVTEFPVRILQHRESESKVRPVRDTLKMLRDVIRIRRTHKNFTPEA